MMRKCAVLTCLVALGGSLVFAADCSGLKNLKLENTEITDAESVTSGSLAVPN